jgi:hypothetical protein
MCYGIDLSNLVKPGEPFELSLRVVDKVGTATKLEGEWFYPGNFDPKEDPRAFATHVYWGDLLLTERFDPKNLHPFRQSPSMSILQERIGKGLVPRGPATMAKAPAVLSLEAPRGVAAGYPFSCGVPLPQGTVKDGYQLRLYDAQGRDLAPQVDELSHWQDDSVRWALVTLPLPADARVGDQWTLSWEAEPRRPDPGVRTREEGGELTVENGLISVRVPSSGSSVIEGVRSASGEELAGPLTGYLVEETDAGPVRYEARWDTRKVIGEGPRQITVLADGRVASHPCVVPNLQRHGAAVEGERTDSQRAGRRR